MSRMVKFLKQTCQLERVSISGGKPVIDTYGELQYESPITIRCRRERYIRDVETSVGAIMKSSHQYYTVEQIGLNDKLDGLVVLITEEYVNGHGRQEGYRSIT